MYYERGLLCNTITKTTESCWTRLNNEYANQTLTNIKSELLTNIINAIFHTLHFPTPWIIATIKLILKPNKPQLLPENRRPISLLPCLSKIAERMILEKYKFYFVPHIPLTQLDIDEAYPLHIP